jgi:hypothetical protein
MKIVTAWRSFVRQLHLFLFFGQCATGISMQYTGKQSLIWNTLANGSLL